MSKTKEDILRHHFEVAKLKYPTENWKDFEEVKIEREFIADTMDEYAAQVLSEYKEKLKAEVKKDIDYYQSIKLTEYGEGHLVGLKDIQKLINGPL